MDHGVGIVLTFVDNCNDCVFDERQGCEDWLVGSFLADGANIYRLLRHKSLARVGMRPIVTGGALAAACARVCRLELARTSCNCLSF